VSSKTNETLEGFEDFMRKQPKGLADLDAIHAYVQGIHGSVVLPDDFSILRVAFS
jgi:hypothetical protein